MQEVVNRTGLFGLYLRKIVLAFNQLLFDGVIRLYEAVVAFRDGTDAVEVSQMINQKSAEKYIFQVAQDIEREY